MYIGNENETIGRYSKYPVSTLVSKIDRTAWTDTTQWIVSSVHSIKNPLTFEETNRLIFKIRWLNSNIPLPTLEVWVLYKITQKINMSGTSFPNGSIPVSLIVNIKKDTFYCAKYNNVSYFVNTDYSVCKYVVGFEQQKISSEDWLKFIQLPANSLKLDTVLTPSEISLIVPSSQHPDQSQQNQSQVVSANASLLPDNIVGYAVGILLSILIFVFIIDKIL